MNASELAIKFLCPEGRELVDKITLLNNTYQTYKRIHMMVLVMAAYQRLKQHVDVECAICKRAKEELADETG